LANDNVLVQLSLQFFLFCFVFNNFKISLQITQFCQPISAYNSCTTTATTTVCASWGIWCR